MLDKYLGRDGGWAGEGVFICRFAESFDYGPRMPFPRRSRAGGVRGGGEDSRDWEAGRGCVSFPANKSA